MLILWLTANVLYPTFSLVRLSEQFAFILCKAIIISGPSIVQSIGLVLEDVLGTAATGFGVGGAAGGVANISMRTVGSGVGFSDCSTITLSLSVTLIDSVPSGAREVLVISPIRLYERLYNWVAAKLGIDIVVSAALRLRSCLLRLVLLL